MHLYFTFYFLYMASFGSVTSNVQLLMSFDLLLLQFKYEAERLGKWLTGLLLLIIKWQHYFQVRVSTRQGCKYLQYAFLMDNNVLLLHCFKNVHTFTLALHLYIFAFTCYLFWHNFISVCWATVVHFWKPLQVHLWVYMYSIM